MTDEELKELKERAQQALADIEAEEKRRAALPKGGAVNMDLRPVLDRMQQIEKANEDQARLLERLNQVSDNLYAKLEKISLDLLQVMALGMPLLQEARR